MKKTVFTGVGTAIVTPMFPDGSVNHKKLAELIDFQIENSVGAIIACGTTGESATLSNDEHIEVIKTAVKAANGRVPVVAGTGSNDTSYGVELSKEALKIGADALLMVTPYYNKTTQKGLIEHYKHIAENVALPIILYNVPSRTGVNIKPQTYLELSKIDNIVGIKEANGDLSALLKTISLCHDSLDIYSGNDDQIIPFYSLGAKGVISVLSNILPKETARICSLCEEGKFAQAVELESKYLELADALFCEVNPIPIKEAMELAGYKTGYCRLPLCRATDEHIEYIRACMEKVGII